MYFPSKYFEDEVRDGFYVPSIMKHIWASQLEVLADIDKVCRKYNITYFADCGSLLGAVRHGGYIPWDDDFDISMKREDYARFLAVAEEALPEGYKVLGFHNEKDWEELFIRVVNSGAITFNKTFLDKFHNFPFVCGIDIFPIDFLPSDKEEEELLHNLIEIVVSTALVVEDREKVSEEEAEESVCRIEELCQMQVDRTRSLKQGLYLLAEALCSLYSEQEASEVTLMPVWMDNRSYRTDKRYYGKSIRIPFENMEIPVPAAYDAILRYRYGDYMKVVRNWDTHDFLGTYSKQEGVLQEEKGVSFTKYAFSVEDLECGKHKDSLNSKGRREVVFLPYKASLWDALESVWRSAIADKNCDVYVIPIPYYDKDLYGKFTAMHYEGQGFPDYVPITRYDAFDFAKHCPDTIFIQNPYDEYNYAISVEPFFYARNLKQYTDNLVYIPYFVLDEIDPKDGPAMATMDYFVLVPGVVLADKVIVQSENMKKLYVDKLVEFAGEKTQNIWEDKILGLGSPKRDRPFDSPKITTEMPQEWRKVIQKPDGTWKIVILYYVSVATILDYKEKMLHKVNNVLKIFWENRDKVTMLWKEDPLIWPTLHAVLPEFLEEFMEIRNHYKAEKWGLYDDSGDLKRAVRLCDAYYGDGGKAAQMCRAEGKPVMIENCDV